MLLLSSSYLAVMCLVKKLVHGAVLPLATTELHMLCIGMLKIYL